MLKRYTRKKPRQHGGMATYLEPQVSNLCGKHSINHVLQEEKFVWDEDNKLLYIPKRPADVLSNREHIKNPKTKINLVRACKKYIDSEIQKSFDEFFEGDFNKLKVRLINDVEPEKDAPKIPGMGTADRKQYGSKTDDQIRAEILEKRGVHFKKQQTKQAEEREKYKNFIQQDDEGNITGVNEEELKGHYEEEWRNDYKDRFLNGEESPCQFTKKNEKGQIISRSRGNIIPEIFEFWLIQLDYNVVKNTINAVSYTHLTLPTILRV